MDMHTHFLRDDTRIMNFVNMRTAVGKAGWNKTLADKEQTIEDLKFANYVKEMFLDSDTKIALISSAPSDIEQDWFLTNEQMARGAREGEQRGRLAAPVLAHDLHARAAGLAREAGRRARAQAGIREGLHGRRQHAQGPEPLSLAHGRREGRLQGLREDGEGRHQERLRAQGAVRAVGREAVPASARLLPTSPTSARRRRTGRSSTSSSITRPIAMSAAIRRWRSPSSSAPAASPGPAISPTSRRNTASATSMATSASCSPPR